MTPTLSISEAGRLVGASPSTLRSWESAGLVRAARRGRNRQYTNADIRELRRIATMRARGYSLAAIRETLGKLSNNGQPDREQRGMPKRAPAPTVGMRLRAIRRRQGLSLREAARRADLSVSHLSSIERGASNISLAALQRLSQALHMQVSDLFERTEAKRRRLLKAGRRPVLQTDDALVRIESLSADVQLLEPHLYVVSPGGGSEGSYKHEGEETVYVIEGAVTFWLDERERYLVEAGDCLTFPSTLQHRWSNALPRQLVMLWVNTPITF